MTKNALTRPRKAIVLRLIGIGFFARRRFDAARMRENWFLVSVILLGSCQRRRWASSSECVGCLYSVASALVAWRLRAGRRLELSRWKKEVILTSSVTRAADRVRSCSGSNPTFVRFVMFPTRGVESGPTVAGGLTSRHRVSRSHSWVSPGQPGRRCAWATASFRCAVAPR